MANDAFISYSHRADLSLAAAVEKALERLARPLLAIRALEVFRDQSDLSATSGLQPSLEAELRASRWLILFACPASAQSTYCQKELQWWLAERGTEKLLLVLTDGQLVWDHSAGDFDWSRTDALSPAAKGAFATEPFFVDLRTLRSTAPLDLTNAPFRAAVLDLAAPIRGVPKNLLDNEDVRRQRRTRLLVRAGVTAITAFAVLAAAAAVVARQQARLSLARQLSAQAVQLVRQQPDLGLLLAVHALQEVDTVDGRRALFDALLDQPHLLRVMRGTSQSQLERQGFKFGVKLEHNGKRPIAPGGQPLSCDGGAEIGRDSGDGKWSAYGCYAGSVRIAGPQGWRATRGRLAHEQPVTGLAFTPDGKVLASAGYDGRILLWHVASGQVMEPAFAEHERPVVALGLAADGQTLASLHDDGSAKLWRLAPRPRPKAPDRVDLTPEEALNQLGEDPAGRQVIEWRSGSAQRLARSLPQPANSGALAGLRADGTPVFANSLGLPGAAWLGFDAASGLAWTSVADSSGSRSRLLVHDPRGLRLTLDTPDHVQAAAVAPGGTRIATASESALQMRALPSGTPVAPAAPMPGQVGGLHFDPAGRWLVAGLRDGRLLPLAPDSGQPLREPIDAHGGQGGITTLAASADGQRLATGGGDAQLVLWDTTDWQPLVSLPVNGFDKRGGPLFEGSTAVASVALSADGSMLAATADEGFGLWMRGASPWIRFGFLAQGVDLVAFAPDGRSLLTHGPDGLLAWRLDLAHWMRLACDVAGRNLTQAEWDEYLSFGFEAGQRWLRWFNPRYHEACPAGPPVK